MIKLLITAGCLIAACSAQAPGGTLEAMCNMGVMQGGVTDALSDSMGRAARTMMQPTMAGNPLAMQTLSGASPQWKCLVDNSARINPRTRQLDVGATAGVISDYFDTVVELKPFIPFFNPCTTVFCGEKGISPVTVATQIVQSMRMRMPLANNLAKLFGAQANRLPFGTTSNPKNPAPRMPGMGMGVPAMGGGMGGPAMGGGMGAPAMGGGMGAPAMGGGNTAWAGTQGGFTRGGAANPMLNMMNLMTAQRNPQPTTNTGGNTNVAPPAGTNPAQTPAAGTVNATPAMAPAATNKPSSPTLSPSSGSMFNPMGMMNPFQAMSNMFRPSNNMAPFPRPATTPTPQPGMGSAGNTGGNTGMGSAGMGGMGMPGMNMFGMGMPGMGMPGMGMPGMGGMSMPGMGGMGMPGMGGMQGLMSAMLMGEVMADAPDPPARRGMGMGGMGGAGMGGMGGMGGAGMGGMGGMGGAGMGGLAALMSGMGGSGMGMPGTGTTGMQGTGMTGMGMPGMGMSSNPMAQLASAMGMGAVTGTGMPSTQTSQQQTQGQATNTGGAGGMPNFATLMRMMQG